MQEEGTKEGRKGGEGRRKEDEWGRAEREIPKEQTSVLGCQ